MAMTASISFPPSNLVCNDEELLSNIIKVVHMGATASSSWGCAVSSIHIHWKVSNQQPYVESISGTYMDEVDLFYHLNIDILDTIVYRVSRDGDGIENVRDILLKWLIFAAGEPIVAENVKAPFTTEMEILKPNTLKVSHIGDRLEALWNLLWYEYKGDIPGYTVSWYLNENKLKLICIRRKGFKVKFMSYGNIRCEVYADGKRYTTYTKDKVIVKDVCDHANSVDKLDSVIGDLHLTIAGCMIKSAKRRL